MGFFLPRWQDDDRWTRIDPLQVRWLKRTEPRYLPWAGLLISAAVLATMYVGFSAIVRSWTAWPPVLSLSLLLVGIVVTGGLLLAAKLAQPSQVGISDRGLIFGRLGGEAVEWDRLIRARRSRWGIAIDFPLEAGWWFVGPRRWTDTMGWLWLSQTATRYIDRGQFRAILQRPQCPPRLDPGALGEGG